MSQRPDFPTGRSAAQFFPKLLVCFKFLFYKTKWKRIPYNLEHVIDLTFPHYKEDGHLPESRKIPSIVNEEEGHKPLMIGRTSYDREFKMENVRNGMS